MLLALLGALALAPFYWLLTPARRRRDVLALASLAVLVAYDPRVAAVVGGVALGLFAALRAMRVPSTARHRVLVVGGLVALAALFVWNKRGARGGGVLPSQGVVLLGVSYLVLKATATTPTACRTALAGRDLCHCFGHRGWDETGSRVLPGRDR